MFKEPHRDYSVLGLTARLETKTDCSAMLELGRVGDTLELNGRSIRCAPGQVFTGVGWLDIHYPCHGFHKLVIRALCPEFEDAVASMHGIVAAVKEWLALDEGVSYEVTLIIGETHHSMEDPFEGIPSYTNRDSFDAPEEFWEMWDEQWRNRNDD